MTTAGPTSLSDLKTRWQRDWSVALKVWSRFTRLSEPSLCETHEGAIKEGLGESFAMIRLTDQSVVVDLETVKALKLEEYAVEILAHEIGHHILAPANLADHFRLLARMRRALPTLEGKAAMVANLFTDLLINDRLKRRSELRMAEIYQILRKNQGDEKNPSRVWILYMRIYEELWKLQRGSLVESMAEERLDTDAWLGARLIRVYADDWLSAGGKFASLILPYLLEDAKKEAGAFRLLHDTRTAAEGAEPFGLVEVEEDENDHGHPNEDQRITGEPLPETRGAPSPTPKNLLPGQGQRRDPFEYGEILKASGINLSTHDLAVRYYRDAAFPYLVPFPSRPSPISTEPLLEGLEPWSLGDPLDEIAWLETIITSPTVIPGLTTQRRQFGTVEGRDPGRVPVDLDLYVDSSGSMPNPQVNVSYPALAGAVVALSCLRAGGSVQATLWSGKNQFTSTPGFVRDPDKVLRVLTAYYGGATAFPIHKLRETFEDPNRQNRPAHILMISDDGITTLFDQDEKGRNGWDVAGNALKAGGVGGTMALNISDHWESFAKRPDLDLLKKARDEQHWEIHALVLLKDLVEFARAFSRKHYSLKNL